MKLAPFISVFNQLDAIYDNFSVSNRFFQVLLHCLRRAEEENTVKEKVQFLCLALSWFKHFSPCTDEERPYKELYTNVLVTELYAQPNVSTHITHVKLGELSLN